MDTNYQKIFSRNIGIFSGEEQETIRNSSIAIAGMGGVGGLLAERLVRLGVGTIKMTDPGTFEESNLNRQFTSSMECTGKEKVLEVHRQIKAINPDATIVCDTKGITSQADADAFVKGCSIVIDEMDFGMFKESIYLQRAARRQGLFYMFSTALGFGAIVVVFSPDGMTLEEYDGLAKDPNLEETGQPPVALDKIIPVLPKYFEEKIDLVLKMASGEIPVSTNSIGVGLTSILTAHEAVNIILQKKAIVTAPRYVYLDLLERIFVG